MPDIITLALIAAASFLGATIAVGYLYGLHLLGGWWRGRNAPAAPVDDAPTGTSVYDWTNDAGVTWRR